MKEALIERIEAFATARQSGNILLQRLAANELTGFLDDVDVVPGAVDAPEELD